MIIYGSEYSDLLALYNPSWGYLAYDTGDPNDPLTTVEVWGAEGLDTIHGSTETNIIYSESLYGEEHVDTIHGHAGDDYSSGGSASDTLNGNVGDDVIDGDGGDDIMDGGAGEDTMSGGTGVDFMSGGDGDDTIDGGAGGDIMCGDGETGSGGVGDVISDGDSDAEALPDRIWAASAVDLSNCADNSKYWDYFGYSGSCYGNPTQTSKPARCP